MKKSGHRFLSLCSHAEVVCQAILSNCECSLKQEKAYGWGDSDRLVHTPLASGSCEYCGVAWLQRPESRKLLHAGVWRRQATHTPLRCLNCNCVPSLSSVHVKCSSLSSVNVDCSLSNVHVESCFAVGVTSLPIVHFEWGILVAARFGDCR